MAGTVTVTDKATKNLKSTTLSSGTFSTSSCTYVDVTNMTGMTGVLDDAMIGICASFTKSTGGTGQARLTEASPSTTWLEVTIVTGAAQGYVISTLQDSGSTQTIDMQALSSDGSNMNVSGTTSIPSSYFTGAHMMVVNVTDRNNFMPMKLSITSIDFVYLTSSGTAGREGWLSGIGASVKYVISTAILNTTVDGLEYGADTATLSGTSGVCMVFDYIGARVTFAA